MRVCFEIAEIKEHLGKPIFDPEHEKKILEDKAYIGADLGLEDVFVRKLMSLIMDYSKRLQSQNRRHPKKIKAVLLEKVEEFVTNKKENSTNKKRKQGGLKEEEVYV